MADMLANVKKFFFDNSLDGFGVRRYIGYDDLSEDVKFLHNRVLPALFTAIKDGDPDWDVDAEMAAGHWVMGPQTSLTEASSTGAVRWFVELMEGHKAFQELIDPYCPLYIRFYKPSNQYGCFLDGLRNALSADDPNWRKPWTAVPPQESDASSESEPSSSAENDAESGSSNG